MQSVNDSPHKYSTVCVVFVWMTQGLRACGLQRPKHMLISVSFLKLGMDIWIRLINLAVLSLLPLH